MSFGGSRTHTRARPADKMDLNRYLFHTRTLFMCAVSSTSNHHHQAMKPQNHTTATSWIRTTALTLVDTSKHSDSRRQPMHWSRMHFRTVLHAFCARPHVQCCHHIRPACHQLLRGEQGTCIGPITRDEMIRVISCIYWCRQPRLTGSITTYFQGKQSAYARA